MELFQTFKTLPADEKLARMLLVALIAMAVHMLVYQWLDTSYLARHQPMPFWVVLLPLGMAAPFAVAAHRLGRRAR